MRIPGGEGAHVGEDEVAGVVAAESGLVFAADDGEGAEDVGGVLAVKAVEVEVEGVEAGAQVAARFLVPAEGWAVVAEVAGEWRQVVGGVGEAQHMVADQLAGGGAAERPVVVCLVETGQIPHPFPRTGIQLYTIERSGQLVEGPAELPDRDAGLARPSVYELTPSYHESTAWWSTIACSGIKH